MSRYRVKIPVVLEVAELHRLFDALNLRERAMVVVDALTGIAGQRADEAEMG
jgi:hypothetical protein